MSKWMSVGLAVLLTGAGCVPMPAVPLPSVTPPPASSPPPMTERDRYIARFCERYPMDRDCGDWMSNRGFWTDERYAAWLRQRRLDRDPTTAALFGLPVPPAAITPGAAAPLSSPPLSAPAPALAPPNALAPPAGVASGGQPDRLARCRASFKSYDERTDTYVGFDGVRRRCPY
ncbi:BA14K family protein [Chthonobacter rhizosphaerae]|uniref:BA14K family protein n=1 Tax=Chthonobacter rhizosphaerae TaxID=2735553 RepID=UPI0015EFCF51|nr:BA14K family protein [Chthonobacter rhizosphaerae]